MDSSFYPSKSLHCIIAGVMRFLRKEDCKQLDGQWMCILLGQKNGI